MAEYVSAQYLLDICANEDSLGYVCAYDIEHAPTISDVVYVVTYETIEEQRFIDCVFRSEKDAIDYILEKEKSKLNRHCWDYYGYKVR